MSFKLVNMSKANSVWYGRNSQESSARDSCGRRVDYHSCGRRVDYHEFTL